jgi:hypothetical protein
VVKPVSKSASADAGSVATTASGDAPDIAEDN